MRKKILIGNWKMNKTRKEAKEFAKETVDLNKLAVKNNIELGIAPSFMLLHKFKKHNEDIITCAQNVSDHQSGAFTGQTSIAQLLDSGITWCLIGHSEVREYLGDTNERCNRKILKLLEHGMTPVYCVGESLQTYEEGNTKCFVEEQIVKGLKDLTALEVRKTVIAYEPIWSIGTGKNASKEIAEQVCKDIRDLVEKLYDKETSDAVRIIYGGSVKPGNIKEYMSMGNIDGALVGGASLEVSSFNELLNNML